MPFTEEGETRGVGFLTPFDSQFGPWGFGLALSDLDGDGDADLFVTGGVGGALAVYENDGNGYFTDRSDRSDLPASVSYNAVAAADYDADGDIDLFVSGWLDQNLLLQNQGGFVFLDVTEAARLIDGGATTGCSWGDVDGDGWLDLYVVNRTGTFRDPIPNRLYLNLQHGTFVETAVLAGIDDDHKGFQSALFDHDRDGDLDLYLSNDKGTGQGSNSNRMWSNDGRGYFSEITQSSGTGVAINSMGLAVGDLDGNGFFDLYCTNTSGNPLLLNRGDGTYVESSGLAEVASSRTGWGTLFRDFDNDGHLDLYVARQFGGNSFFECGEFFPCEEVSGAYGLDFDAESYCFSVADLDADGDLDIVLQSRGERIQIFINHEGERRNWLAVKLVGEGGNKDAVGAIVDISVGGALQCRQLLAGAGYKSSVPLTLHFGCGDADIVDRLVVHWPSGGTTEMIGVDVNQRLVILESDSFEDCNGNRIDDRQDILDGTSLDLDGDDLPDECSIRFRRGDSNVDGGVDIGDAIFALQYAFAGYEATCLDAIDVTDDGLVNVSDPVLLLSFLFRSGQPPASPGLSCGVDPTTDDLLGCEESSAACSQ